VPEQAFLQIDKLDAGYGEARSCSGSISHPRRGAVAILGRHGAGKTTLMKTSWANWRFAAVGCALTASILRGCRPKKRVRLGLGYVPQEYSVFARLSVRDNLAVGALTNRDKDATDRVHRLFPSSVRG